MTLNVIGIIQARTGSTRLKNKIFEMIDNKLLIERVIDRVKQASLINKVVVATTMDSSDDVFTDWCEYNSVYVFRGSDDNVLDRFYKCAEFYKADVIVRITADDPFKDPIIINHAIDLLIKNNFDYVSNTINPTFPEGVDVEVFRFDSLKTAFYEAKLGSEKEHVTPYIWKNPEKFALHNFENNENISHLRWTIDYAEDLEFANAIYKKLRTKNNIFFMEDVLTVLKEFPEFLNIQKKVARNEGYFKSTEEE